MKNWLALTLLLSSPMVGAATPPPGAKDAMLAQACTGCHGEKGNSAGPSIPRIAGQRADYLKDSLRMFKTGERPSTLMQRIAKGYKDDDFARMANWFEAQKLPPSSQQTEPRLVARGKELADKRCADCHLRDGWGSRHGAAYLAGQWLPYLRIQTRDFLAKKRPFPEMMDEAYIGLTQDDLEAISHFYASQTNPPAQKK